METNHIQEKCFFLCSWQRFNPDSQLYTPFENRFMRAEEKKKKKATTCLALACVAVSFFVTMFSFIFITKKLKKKKAKKINTKSSVSFSPDWHEKSFEASQFSGRREDGSLFSTVSGPSNLGLSFSPFFFFVSVSSRFSSSCTATHHAALQLCDLLITTKSRRFLFHVKRKLHPIARFDLFQLPLCSAN